MFGDFRTISCIDDTLKFMGTIAKICCEIGLDDAVVEILLKAHLNAIILNLAAAIIRFHDVNIIVDVASRQAVADLIVVKLQRDRIQRRIDVVIFFGVVLNFRHLHNPEGTNIN